VWLPRGGADYVFDRETPYQQRVGEEPTMAAPRNRFGTHQRRLAFFRQTQELAQRLLEFRRLHIIGVPAEGRVPPGLID
jgi:hypothetical protein